MHNILPSATIFIENPRKIKEFWKIGCKSIMVEKYDVKHAKPHNILYTIPVLKNQKQKSLRMEYSEPYYNLEDWKRELFKKRCIGFSKSCSEYPDIELGDMNKLYDKIGGDSNS